MNEAVNPAEQPAATDQRRDPSLHVWILLGVAIVVIFITWVMWRDAWLIVAGVALAVILVAFGKVGATAVAPSRELARAAAPLVLPFLVIVTVGTIKYNWPVRLAVGGGAALIAWYWIVRPELPRRRWRHLRDAGGVVAGTVIACIVLWLLEGAEWFDEIGGFVTWLFLVASALWVVALAGRLLSYGTTPLRLVVSAALAATVLCLTMKAGLLGGSGKVLGQDPETFILIAAGALLLESARGPVSRLLGDRFERARIFREKVSASRKRLQGSAEARVASHSPDWLRTSAGQVASLVVRVWRWTTSRAAALGIESSVFASVVLVVAIVASLSETSDQGIDRGPPAASKARLENGTPPGQIAGSVADAESRDTLLADQYQPVLAFTEAQRWTPINVDRYLHHPTLGDAVLSGPPSTQIPPSKRTGTDPCDPQSPATPCYPKNLDGLPESCPGLARSPCYRLDIHCKKGDDPCADGRTRPKAFKPFEDDNGAVYVRVLHRPRVGRDEPGNVFRDVGPFRRKVLDRPDEDELSILLQYWYFYRYDEWTQTVLPGKLTQRHEADWEAVTVGLSKRKPLFVAYSAHCGGNWREWKARQIPAAAIGRESTHPLVAVAEGSQANYPRANQKRAPEWESCSNLPGFTTDLASYAANIRDRTAYDWQWIPKRPPILVSEKSPPMSFPGRWGGNDETTLVNKTPHDPLATGLGPQTPSLQPLWQDPVKIVFCTRYWRWPPKWRGEQKARVCKPRETEQ